MSIVDMMASDVWSDADILRRTEAMIRGEFGVEEEAVLNRKATGAAVGQYVLTPDEQLELARYAQIAEEARQAGVQARADMALLHQVLTLEVAHRRLAQAAIEPVLDEDGNVTNQNEIDQDFAERAEAQAAVDAASPEATELYDRRNPPPPEEPLA